MKRFEIDENWQFRVRPSGTDDGDGLWQDVRLPHDAMISSARGVGEPSSTGGAFFAGQTVQYRRIIEVPDEWRGNAVILDFEGVYRNAIVRLNGIELARHAYGYTGFLVDLTKGLRIGERNLVEVEVDNAETPNSRWYSGTGIYRPVGLLLGGSSYIRPYGVTVETESVHPASVRVHTAVTNHSDDIRVHVEIMRDGRTMAYGEGTDVSIVVPGAAFWDDETPNLYQAQVSLLDVNGTVLDETVETFGIRKVEWSSKGLFVNGRSVKLRGGCVHHDNGVLGACAYEEAEWRRVRIMRSLGYNAIRSAHNPCSEAMKRACDHYGMYLIDEMWDMWYERKNRYDYALDFADHWREDVASVIERDRNHPSVLMHSIGNENLEPFDEQGLALQKAIIDECHRLDRTRPVTQGVNLTLLFGASKGKGLYREPDDGGDGAKPSGSMLFNMLMTIGGVIIQRVSAFGAVDRVVSPALDALDIAGYNYATDRYGKDATLHPDRLIYGSETMPYQLAGNWRKVERMDHAVGDFMWTAWDYLGEAGIGSWSYRDEAAGFNKAYPWLLAEAGAIDMTGHPGAEAEWASVIWGTADSSHPYVGVTPPVPKGSKLHKAYWRGTNAIDSWSWNGMEDSPVDVEVYAKAASAEIRINGQSLGRKRVKDCKAVFHATYRPGVLDVITFDESGKPIGHNHLRSAKGSVGLTLSAEPYELPEDSAMQRRKGRIRFVNLVLDDIQGNVEANADRAVKLDVEGGELLGFGSAQPCTDESFVDETTTTYRGRALAVVRIPDGGRAVVHAQAEGGVSASLPIK